MQTTEVSRVACADKLCARCVFCTQMSLAAASLPPRMAKWAHVTAKARELKLQEVIKRGTCVYEFVTLFLLLSRQWALEAPVCTDMWELWWVNNRVGYVRTEFSQKCVQALIRDDWWLRRYELLTRHNMSCMPDLSAAHDDGYNVTIAIYFTTSRHESTFSGATCCLTMRLHNIFKLCFRAQCSFYGSCCVLPHWYVFMWAYKHMRVYVDTLKNIDSWTHTRRQLLWSIEF